MLNLENLENSYTLHDTLFNNNVQEIIQELSNYLDKIIELDSQRIEGQHVDEQLENEIVQSTFGLIHEYATSKGIPGEMSKLSQHEEGINIRLKLCGYIQHNLLSGINPISDLEQRGIDSALLTHDLYYDNILSKKEKELFLQSMEFNSYTYAESAKESYKELEEDFCDDSQTTSDFYFAHHNSFNRTRVSSIDKEQDARIAGFICKIIGS